MTPGADGPAAARWRRLVSDRLEERERLAPGLGSLSGGFWDRRADRYADRTRLPDPERDPFLRRLRAVAQPSSTVIDAGAGTGRFALPLAPGVGSVTAVEPSEAMLAVLRREAGELGVDNVNCLQSTWERAGDVTADVVFSAYVLTLVPDARPFLLKLDAAARSHVLLYLGTFNGDAALDPLWRHFHGAPRVPGASYLDALAVVRELGLAPSVKLIEIANSLRFATVEAAVEHYREWLLLPDTAEARSELHGLLAEWLLGRRGALRSPLRSAPAAIIHWRPRCP